MSRVLLTIVALAATAVLRGATSADAAVLGAQTTCDKYMSCSYVVSYTADPGERNDVRIVRRESALAVSDSGAAIRAGAGCTGAGSQLVTCVFADPVARIRVDTGDGADRVDAAALDNGTRAIVDGGTGDDTLIGSAFEDTLTGGSGNDTIDGGGGTDTASFDERRRARLRVDLRTGIATAAGGERDTLARIENLRGGAGDDLIRLAGHGRAICGAGAGDLVAASGTASIVDDSCEGLRLPGGRSGCISRTVIPRAMPSPSRSSVCSPATPSTRG